jgi:hypothetical protein
MSRYICISDERLSYKQYTRLIDILDYIRRPRPNLNWGGKKRESRHLSDNMWREKLSNVLYGFYRDLYPDDVFTREHVDDLFDEAYVTSLLSFGRSIKNLLRRSFTCCYKPTVIEVTKDTL